MTYTTEFPDFVLDVEMPEGFADQSWRNDSCPCFVNDDLGLCIWVDFADPADREFPEIESRFSITRLTDTGEHPAEMEEPALATDDWREIHAFVAEKAAARLSRGALNDWYETNVGYRPDDEEKTEIGALRSLVADMMVLHTIGE